MGIYTVWAPSSWLCSMTKLKEHSREVCLAPSQWHCFWVFVLFLSMWPPSRWVDGMVLVGEMVGWAAWWWEWGQTQDEIIWEGREQICSSSLWSGLFLPLSEIWNFLTKLPNWGDSANMFRNIPIISLLILLILFVHPHCRQWWQCVLLKYFREEFFYREKLLKRGRKHWIDVGEGREVLPIKADGDGFAQEVRLHLFYYCTQKEMLRDAQASLEKT